MSGGSNGGWKGGQAIPHGKEERKNAHRGWRMRVSVGRGLESPAVGGWGSSRGKEMRKSPAEEGDEEGKGCAAAGQPRRDGRLPVAPRGVTGVSC